MTESSDTFEVTLSPSHLLHAPAYGVAIVLAAMVLYSPIFWILSTFASDLSERANTGLMLLVTIAFFIPTGFTYRHIHKRQLANNMRTLRVSPARIEYFGRGQEILGCDRASLQVRRLRFIHPTGGEAADQPDTMAIELSGPGLRPLVIYKFDMYSHEMWKQSDEVIRRLPEFTVERRDWIKLRAALDLKH